MKATISEKTKKQFIEYAKQRAKYGRCVKSPGLPQLKSLDSAGFIEREGCGTIEEITDAGMDFLKSHLEK